jgi:hypothetical protein
LSQTDAVATAGTDIAGPRWLELCAFDTRIFEMNWQVWEANGLQEACYGHAIGSYARMYRWQQELAGGK